MRPSGQHVQQKVNRGLAWIGAAQSVISVLDIVTVLIILRFFVSRADFYFLADREAASPYIWAHPLNTIPGAKAALARTLATPQRPRLVVLFQRRPLEGRDWQVDAMLDHYYKPVWQSPSRTTVLEERNPGRVG